MLTPHRKLAKDLRELAANLGQNRPMATGAKLATVDIPLERDVFLRTLLRELSGTLQDVVGLEEAAGFVAVVGQSIGEQLNAEYRAALQLSRLNRTQVGEVLVDLKARIQGDFFVLEEGEDKIVFGNRVCPFGDKVLGRPSLCMMTSNVFGSIAAENLGYARVVLDETIASGAKGCRVVLHLKPEATEEPVEGREYFGERGPVSS